MLSPSELGISSCSASLIAAPRAGLEQWVCASAFTGHQCRLLESGAHRIQLGQQKEGFLPPSCAQTLEEQSQGATAHLISGLPLEPAHHRGSRQMPGN